MDVGSIDDAVCIIRKNLVGQDMTNVLGNTNPSSTLLVGVGREITRIIDLVIDRLIEARV
jgi:hypothetical protein